VRAGLPLRRRPRGRQAAAQRLRRWGCLAVAATACGYRPVYGPPDLRATRALCVEPVRATRLDEPQLAGVLGSALTARLAARGWRCEGPRPLRLQVQLVRWATVAGALRARRVVAERHELTVTAWLHDHAERTIWRSGLLRFQGANALEGGDSLAAAEQLRASASAALACAAATELAVLVALAVEDAP